MKAQTETAEKVDDAVDGVTNWWNDPATHELMVERPLKILLILIVALVLTADRISLRARAALL